MTRSVVSVLAFAGALVLTSCGGGDEGVPLGSFPDITVTEGDAPIFVKPPSSKSPGVFTITSSNPSVVTVSSDFQLTPVKIGTAVLTASQPETGSYNPTSITAKVTVKERVCVLPQVKQGQVCVTPPKAS